MQEQRVRAGLSQKEVAGRLNFANKSIVGIWETGVAPIPIERLFDLAEIYGLNMDEVLKVLQECEPKTAQRFGALSQRFAKYHLGLMQTRAEARAHHRGFDLFDLLPEAGTSDNVRYSNLVARSRYIMSTWPEIRSEDRDDPHRDEISGFLYPNHYQDHEDSPQEQIPLDFSPHKQKYLFDDWQGRNEAILH